MYGYLETLVEKRVMDPLHNGEEHILVLFFLHFLAIRVSSRKRRLVPATSYVRLGDFLG